MFGDYSHFRKFEHFCFAPLISFFVSQHFDIGEHGSQIDQLCDNISIFGPVLPILIGNDEQIVLGHQRFEALKKLGWSEFPMVDGRNLNNQTLSAYAQLDLLLMMKLPEWHVDHINTMLSQIFSAQEYQA